MSDNKHTPEPLYMEVDAEVRYWEDAMVNGAEDSDGTLIPSRKGNSWCPVIRLHDGLVMDWPLGFVADVHYKVCDAGEYWLLNEHKNRIAKWSGFYVPNSFLCQGSNGYGDYIILKIDAEGFIKGWTPASINFVCECDEYIETGWKAIDRVKSNNAGY